MTAFGKVVECGCTLIVSHTKGEITKTCEGSDGRIPDGVLSIKPDAVKPCPGGVRYRVTARPSTRYTAERIDPETAA